jgi:hypothetical protein
MGGDDEIEVLAQYYNLPYVATRSLMWDAVYDPQGGTNRSTEGPWPYFHIDRNHPNDIGHQYVAEMVILFFRRVLEDLHFRPHAPHDDAVATAPLRPPMLRNNWPNANNSCLMGRLFNEHVTKSEGFEWVNEGSEEKPKWGWVGTEPGATLRFSVNTATALAAVSSRCAAHRAPCAERVVPMGAPLGSCPEPISSPCGPARPPRPWPTGPCVAAMRRRRRRCVRRRATARTWGSCTCAATSTWGRRS